MVGSNQEIWCTVSTVSGINSDSIMIIWVGPGEDTISTIGDRVMSTPIVSNDNVFTRSMYFNYLMEGDEGIYTCIVMVLETNATASVQLETLTSK